MNKQTLLDCIADMLRYKDAGEENLYAFASRECLSERTYMRALQRGFVHFFVPGFPVNHQLYEIFFGEGRKVILSTHSYTLPAVALSVVDLKAIYRIMRQEYTREGIHLVGFHP